MKKESSSKVKQVSAIIGIIIIAAFIIATLVAAIVDVSGQLFQALLVCDIGLPILFWIYIEIYKLVVRKKSEAAAFPNDEK